MAVRRTGLARARKAAGFTQEKFAEAAHVEPTTVGRWEAGTREPLPYKRPLIARLLKISMNELDELLHPEVGSVAVTQRVTEPAVPAQDMTAVAELLGPAHAIDLLDTYARSVIARYELEGPHRLLSEVQALRKLSHHLGGQVSGTTERTHLARAGARHAALLAYMSVNLSRFTEAEQYALEASMLATALGDAPLLAWIKGTQSFAAYYQEKYQEALNVAQVGLQIAGDDQQRIRLLSNGVARAAAKLGNKRFAEQSVDAALELVEHADAPRGMTSCIDFEPYGWARTAANAATAHLSAGNYTKALALTEELQATVADSDSDWSKSLVSLDEAAALTLGRQADLEQAAAVGLAALATSATKPIASVASRARELATSLRQRGPTRTSEEFSAALHEWHKEAEEC
jgi:transcriptional regulator with XRE-family HTH domain/osmotically-inducible protein OsmY